MILITRNNNLNKEVNIDLPASKSISNRLLILQAFEESIKVYNLSTANDTKILHNALSQINSNTANELIIDVEDAGTAFRFLLGYCALQNGTYIIQGSKRLSERPIKPLVEALIQLGAGIEYMDKIGFAPLKIRGRKMMGGCIELDASISSQFISSLLLIGWKFENGLTLELKNKIVSNEYIKMTISLLQKAKIEVVQESNTISIAPNQKLHSFQLEVEKDWSAASYFYALMLGFKTGSITFKGLTQSSIQGDKAISEMASLFGIKTMYQEESTTIHYEPIDKKESLIFDCINCPDLAQTLMVMCCIIGRNACFKGLHTLPNKETNRIVALEKELKKLGFMLKAQGNEYSLEREKDIIADTISVTTYQDHRMAMSFSAMATKFNIEIEEPDVVHKSFPDFWNQLANLGFKIKNIV